MPDSKRTPGIRDWLRPDRRQLVVAAVLAVVSFAVVTQIRTREEVDSYSSLRQSDLVEMLDSLNQESQRLESELGDLEAARQQLRSGQDSEALARRQAEQRLTVLGILAGTQPAHGPGITVTVGDPAGKVTSALLLDAVEEMRDAGAEVIEINDSVRVVGASWFTGSGSSLSVDGKLVRTPITIDVIGDPHALEEAARFRGGLVSQVEDPRIGGSVTIERSDPVRVTSVRTSAAPAYAQPVDPAGGTGGD